MSYGVKILINIYNIYFIYNINIFITFINTY